MNQPRLALLLLGFTLLLAGLAGAAPGDTVTDEVFSLGPVGARPLDNGALEIHVQASTRKKLAWAKDVPMPVSLLRMVGRMRVKNALLESTLLQSLYEVDLNGDGRINQVTVRDRDGVLRIDQLKVEPMADGFRKPQRPYREDGSPKLYILSPDAPRFSVLFYEPPMMALALQHQNYRPTIERFPNPCVQILVFEPCGALEGASTVPDDPSFQVSFAGKAGQDGPEVRRIFAWEPWIFERLGKDLQWLRGWWVALPMPTEPGQEELVFTVTPSRDSQFLGMMAQVNYSVEKDVRLRTEPILARLHQKAPPHTIEK